jgi:uncharacterized protein DUF6502
MLANRSDSYSHLKKPYLRKNAQFRGIISVEYPRKLHIMSNKQTLVIALRTLLRPIIRLMIALGFNARDFMEVVKIVYTEVATQEYGKRGRDANASRVALLSGLTRREVSRLRKVSSHDPLGLDDPMVPLGRVLSDWHQDPQYLDETGSPRKLPLQPTFMALVNKHRGDIPATTIVKELEEHGSIKVEQGRAIALSRYFMPFEMDSQAIERFGRVMGDMGNAISRNLLAKERDQATFEGRAVNELVSTNATDAFRKFLDRRAMAFLEDVDNWLSDHSEPESDESTRLGVGIYTIGSMD